MQAISETKDLKTFTEPSLILQPDALDTPSADSTLNEMSPVIGQYSEDGQWKWDGSDWAPAN